MRWMYLESIILTEVSQKEKNKYHIHGILKDYTAEICRAAVETDREQTYGRGLGAGERRG